MAATPELLAVLRRIRARHRSQADAAHEIGITSDRLGRVLAGGEYSLSVENIVSAAIADGQDPAAVLRAAGKTRMADLLDRAYLSRGRRSGADQEATEAFLTLWKRCGLEQRVALMTLLHAFGEPGRLPQRKKKASDR